MKLKIFGSIVFLLGFTIAGLAFDPGNLRYQFPCKAIAEDRPEFAAADFNDSAWPDMKPFMGRRYQVEQMIPPGGIMWNRVHLQIGAAMKGRDLVIGIEDGQLLDAVYFNGKPLLSCWQSPTKAVPPLRRCAFAVPPELIRYDGANLLALRYYYYPQPREDTLGRVELREATAEDCAQIGAGGVAKNPSNVAVIVSSGLPRAQNVKVIWRFEDYFGAALAEGATNLALNKAQALPILPGQPGAIVNLTLDLPINDRVYKLVCWLETEKGAGPETWKYIAKLDTRTPFRMTRLLNKGWDFAQALGVKELKPSASKSKDLDLDAVPGAKDEKAVIGLDGKVIDTLPWNKVSMPHYIRDESRKAHRMWYRTKLAVPAEMAGKRITLSFFQVAYQVEAFVDNVFVERKPSWELPGEIDLTGKVTPGGTNELLLGVTDFIAMLTPELRDKAVDGNNSVPSRGLIGSAKGFAMIQYAGIPCVPELKAYPKDQRLDWIGVESEVDQPKNIKRLKITIQAANATATDKQVKIQTEILLKGKLVKRLQDKELLLKSGVTNTVIVDSNFPEGASWTLNTPTLYQARVRLLEKETVIDEQSERFGFRQFGTAGRYITLNGFPIRAIGSAMWRPSTSPRQVETLDMCRLNVSLELSFTCAVSAGELDVYDEVGGLVAAEDFDLHACCRPLYAYEDPRLYSNIVTKFESRIRRLYNHPAIMIWGWGCEFPYYINGAVSDQGVKLACEAEAKIQQADPSRFSSCTSIGLGRGYSKSRLLSTHNELGSSPGQFLDLGLWYFQPVEKVPDYLRDVFGRELSEVGYLSEADKKQSRFWPGVKPVYDCERGYTGYCDDTTDQLSCPLPQGRKFGHGNFWRTPGAWFSSEVERGYFHRLGQTWTRGFCTTTHCAENAGEEQLARAVVFPKYWENKFRGGEELDYPLFIVNNYLWPETVAMEWGLYNEDGKQLAGGKKAWPIAAATLQEDRLALPLPPVKEAEYCRLVYTVTSKTLGKEYRGWERLTIFPDDNLKKASRDISIALYDPAGTTQAAFEKAGIKHALIGTLTETELARHGLLVIGENGVDDAVVRAMDKIRAAVEGGLTCAVLLQDDVKPIFPVSVIKDSSRASVQAWLLNPSHPLVQGLRVDDFRYWRNPNHDHIVTINPIRCPSHENVQEIVRGCLLEIPAGKGRYVVCQMPLARDLESEPVVVRLLENLMGYVKNAPKETPARLLYTLEGDCEAIGSWVKKFGLETSKFPALDPAKAILLARAATLTDADAARIKGFVAGGGILWLKEVDSNAVPWLARNLGLAVEAASNPKCYALLKKRVPLVAGLSNAGLCWSPRAPDSDPRQKEPTEGDLGWVELKMGTNSAGSVIDPSYLVRIDYGRGAVVLDNVRWLNVDHNKAQDYFCQLAWNLGVRGMAHSKKQRPDYSKLYEFTPLDLSPFVNCSFADEKAGDNKGWSDQGPGNDMSHLPVGTNLYCLGVPVKILEPKAQGGNGCIALAGGTGGDHLPREVKGIKVGKKANALYFFHTAAGDEGGGDRLRYRVWYEERKDWIPGQSDPNVDVMTRAHLEIEDWWTADQIVNGSRDEPPGAWLAWAEKNRQHLVGFYMQEWKNPHPEKVIESIDITSVGTVGQYFVLGITAGNVKK